MSCWRISILHQSEAILSISAAYVRTTTTYLSPRAMVATGPLGEISQSFSGGIHTTTILAPELMRSPGRGNAGAVRGDIANPTYGIKPVHHRATREIMRPIGLTLFPTGGMWQALSRGDREEARPITGVLAMALIRNLFVGGFVEILRPLFRGRRDARKSRVSATVSF
jgi:hypothetical protein